MVNPEPRSSTRVVGELIFIVIASLAVLAWLGLLLWAAFVR